MLKLSKFLYPVSLLFIFILIVSVPGVTYAKKSKSKKMVRVMGTGNIIEDDTSDAKDLAISNGLIAAVEMVMADIMPPETVVNNFRTINEILYGYTDNFIQGYKVLAEVRYESQYRVMVEAVVSTKKVKNRLIKSGIVIDPSNKYKILFLVSENNLEDLAPQFWWGEGHTYIKTVSSNTISKVIKKKGFKVLNPRLVKTSSLKRGDEETPMDENISVDDAINIGLSVNADIVILGHAEAAQSSNSMGEERSFTGTVSVNIYRTDTKEKLGSVTKKAAMVNTDEAVGSREALTEAAMLSGNEAASIINLSMKEVDNKPTMIEVVIEGTNFFANYSKLNKKIKVLPGVKRVKQREKRQDKAIIIVDYVGSGNSLAKILMAETFESFGLNISEVSQNHIRLEMVPLTSNIFVR